MRRALAENEPGASMSFLEHLDELRKRIVRCVAVVIVTFFIAYGVSDKIYNFLSIPIVRALSEASRREVPPEGVTGTETIKPLSELGEGQEGRYNFDRPIQLGGASIASG